MTDPVQAPTEAEISAATLVAEISAFNLSC
jgi:hypothetical protein